jgi:hypothetical protein
MTLNLIIHCAILGEQGIFEVEIDCNSPVNNLKKEVRAEKWQTLNSFEANWR